jgi:hypothetical protein
MLFREMVLEQSAVKSPFIAIRHEAEHTVELDTVNAMLS